MRLFDDVVGRPHIDRSVNFREKKSSPSLLFLGVEDSMLFLFGCSLGNLTNRSNKIRILIGTRVFSVGSIAFNVCLSKHQLKNHEQSIETQTTCLQLQFHLILFEIEQLEVSETIIPRLAKTTHWRSDIVNPTATLLCAH